MWQERLSEFVTLIVVLNPFAAIPVYLIAAAGLEAPKQRLLALHAVVISFAVLLFFVFAGSFLLKHMGISIRAFQIAGGIVLFMFAVAMVIGAVAAPHGEGAAEESLFARAVYPLAIPKIAGPGAMLTVMVLTDDDRANFGEKFLTIGVLVLVLAIQFAVLWAATSISRLLGEGGANVISRIFGMLLAALAVNIVLTALAGWLSLPPL